MAGGVSGELAAAAGCELAGAADPALQISLNGPANHRRQPNENLARELTGYRLSANGELRLVPRRHDAGAKTILGRTAAFEAGSLAAWLCEQPATARWIAWRLWRQLIGSPPPPQRTAALAAQWQRNELALPWLMTALPQSPEAKKTRDRGLRLADPLALVARSLRVLGSRHPNALAIGGSNGGAACRRCSSTRRQLA